MMKLFYLAILCTQVLGLPPPDADDVYIPKVIGQRMTLTPGDLKRFAGHALKLLENKCPKVQASTIFELNRFIGKAISKDTDPVPGDDAAFRDVIKSVTTCAKANPETAEAKDDSFSPPEYFFFSHPIAKSADVNADDDGSSDEFEVRIMTDGNDEVSAASAPSKTTEEPIRSTDGQTKRSHPFLTWVSSIVSSVKEFFRNLFGTRHRRSSGDAPAQVPHSGGIMHQTAAESDTTTGKGAFTKLFTEVCRIYCQKCHHDRLMSANKFKTAAKELLEHIFKIVDLDLAATHHLTKEFMQTVKECQ